MATRVAGQRMTLGLGAVGKQGVETVQRPKALEFFREVARCVPWTIHNYHLEELTNVKEFRKNISALFRQNADVQSPEVINLLIYKGRGELESILLQHKQRHHLITKYVREPLILREAQAKASAKPSGYSSFLEKFYAGNL